MAVIDIRGTHGSGKTHLVRSLLQRYQHEPIEDQGTHLGYHLLDVDTAVVGSYDRVCGGCDGIGSADEVVERVRVFSKVFKHVVLEGILVAHTFKRYSLLADELKHYGYNFCFLDTPLNVCIERVRQRRLERGATKPFNPKNTVKDWGNINKRVKHKMATAGHTVYSLSHIDPMPIVLNLLGDY